MANRWQKVLRWCLYGGASLVVFVLVWGAGLVLAEEPASLSGKVDFSAYRIDSDVWGWSRDYTEMTAIGSEIRRYPLGKQRGEAFLLVFDVDKISPKENVHVLYITQADMPHDPLPVDDVRNRSWGIDHQYQRMWPRRRKKHLSGKMKVIPIWEYHPQKNGDCIPAVGFLLRYKGVSRYLSHRELPLSGRCETIEMTNQRTYWGKRDLAATMLRFDMGRKNIDLGENAKQVGGENSTRFPVSVPWYLAKPYTVLVHSLQPKKSLKGIMRQLKHTITPKFTKQYAAGEGVRIQYGKGFEMLARYWAKELNGVADKEYAYLNGLLITVAPGIHMKNGGQPSTQLGASSTQDNTTHNNTQNTQNTQNTKNVIKIKIKEKSNVSSPLLDNFTP